MDGKTVRLAKGENRPATLGPFSPCGTPFHLTTAAMKTAPTVRKKSEKRQRNNLLQVRYSDDEWTALNERAAQSGLSRPDYVRATSIEAKPLRKVRQRTPERVLLVKIETALNRIGGNVNQIAAKANSAGFLTKPEREALQALIADAHKIVEHLLPTNDDDYQSDQG